MIPTSVELIATQLVAKLYTNLSYKEIPTCITTTATS